MSAERRRPSPVVMWLLASASSREKAESVVGDILEEWDERAADGRTPRPAWLWLNRQALGAVVALMRASMPRSLRSAGHIVRDAARTLRRSPGQALFILAILSVGLSAATTMFSVVDTVLFRPYPFDRSDDILRVAGRNTKAATALTPEQFWAVHDRVPGIEAIAPLSQSLSAISIGGVMEKEHVGVMHTTAEMFKVLRVKSLAGRLWTSEDERRGDTGVAVLSYRFWQTRFGGDQGVIGQSVQVLDQRVPSHRIVGILPPEATFPTRGSQVDLWVPSVPAQQSVTNDRGVSALARVRTGVSIQQLLAQVQSVTAGLPPARGTSPGDWKPEITHWNQQASDPDVRLWLFLLTGVVTLIVLIACFNAANVMLTRSARRARELALRASLGASRRHLVATLVAESLMLSVAATLCGLAFATWALGVVRLTVPVALFRREEMAVDGRVFAAAALAAVVTGLLFGLVPAWQATRVSVVALLKDGGSTLTGVRRRWRSVFLISEVACIGILLVVSTLFISSFTRVTSVDLGFDRSKLIGISTVTGYQGTVEDVRQRFANIPGVSSVAAVAESSLPLLSSFGGAFGTSKMQPAGGPAGAAAEIELYRVTPNYFDIMGIQFQRGSVWSGNVAATSEFQPLVIEEQTASRLFGTGNAVGQKVRVSDLDGRVFTIVGTVAPVLPHGPEQTNDKTAFYGRPTAYYAMNTATRPSWVSFLLRTASAPSAVLPQVENVYASVAPPSISSGAGVRLFDEGYLHLTAKRRFNANLMSAFAFFAILIGVAGIYAVMASVVAQQTREIGVRMALGATAADIRRGVLGMAGRHVVIGLAIGLPVAWAISRQFASLFFQVQPSDVSVYVTVAVLLSAISVAGALIPARRAARVDPMISLRAS